jgi:bacterioferritin
MKGSPEVITLLNEAIGLEATLNEQYRLNARSLKYLGLKKSKCKFESFGDDTSNWRRDLSDMVYFYDGTPQYQVASPQERSSVEDIFRSIHDAEVSVCDTYEQNIQTAMRAFDDETRNLFEHLIKWHHAHIAWLERQMRLIGTIGVSDYIAERGK